MFDISLFPFHRNAAVVMLSGQVADGFVTIFVGELVFKPYFPPSFLGNISHASVTKHYICLAFLFFLLIFSPCVVVSLGVGECIALACVITE